MNQTNSLAFLNETLVSQIANSTSIFYKLGITGISLSFTLGFTGNLLALMVFAFLDEFRRISTGLFFVSLSVFNCIHLTTLTFESLTIYEYIVPSSLYFQCSFVPFVKNVTCGMSIYLSVGITVDRLIRSEFPLRSRIICTSRNAFLFSYSFFVIFVLLWFLYLIPFGTRQPLTGLCLYNTSTTYGVFLVNVNVPLRSLVYCVIPVIVMISANMKILRNIRRSQLRVNGGMLASVVISGPVCRRVSTLDRMLSYMMVANVVTFILTQIPLHIYSVTETYVNMFDPKTTTMIYGVMLIWSSLYFGIAFYLYCLTLPLFRRQCLMMIHQLSKYFYKRTR